MIIVEYNEGTMNEWMLIETQGRVEFASEPGCTLKDDNEFSEMIKLGKLTLDGERASLTIGNHVLPGRVVALKKPLLLLKKCIDHDETRYESRSIIKCKILFKNRPSIVA